MPHDLPRKLRFGFPGFRGSAGSSRGFSLVEVVLALGILTFAGITTLALLPLALTTLQEVTFDTVATRISSRVQADLQQVGLVNAGSGISFYNSEGFEVDSGTAEAVFQVYRSESSQTLPGATPAGLRKVLVQVVSNPGDVLPVDSSGLASIPASMPSKTFRFYVMR